MVGSYDTTVFSKIDIECAKCPQGRRPILAEFYLSEGLDRIISAKNQITDGIRGSEVGPFSPVLPVQIREGQYAIDRCPICAGDSDKSSLTGEDFLKQKGLGKYGKDKTLDALEAVWDELQNKELIKSTCGIRLENKHDNRKLSRKLPIFRYMRGIQEKRASGDTDPGVSVLMENYESFEKLEDQHGKDKALIMSTEYFQSMLKGLENQGYIFDGRPLEGRGDKRIIAPEQQMSIHNILVLAGVRIYRNHQA
ncbi:hypothetical protein [Bifidobacterium sp. ESL0764]|uniref:hypothetical protein n=1 Tax=Bifidobacterium sp. ESL0764 TaxID=2983228 RepID=UPI0023F799AD|nr:hypothetical protein [Bifidobacterium sp. ESL0764]WEV65607.1 hypothetical protein OZX71_07635 [Bifidobacterium sp. ESL0764]